MTLIDFNSFYLTDFLIGMAVAVLIALGLGTFLVKLTKGGKLDDYQPLGPVAIVVGALSAAAVYGVLYIIDNSTPLMLFVWAVIGGIGGVLSMTDFKFHRAPNMYNLNQAILVTGALLINTTLVGNWADMMWASIALVGSAVALFPLLYVVRLGAGDIKYIPVVTMALAYVNIWLAVAYLIASYLLNFVFAIGMFIVERGKGVPAKEIKGPMIPPYYYGILVLPLLINFGMVGVL